MSKHSSSRVRTLGLVMTLAFFTPAHASSGSRVINTYAGGGVGDGRSAIEASMVPTGLAADSAGNLYIADGGNSRVRKVDLNGIISTIAGNGFGGFSGDGGPATEAKLYATGVALDRQGNLFVADSGTHRIRRVDAETGVITTVAGNGEDGFAGDLGPSTQARLSRPEGVAVDDAGNLFIADTGNDRIRKVDADGRITTIAGNALGLLLGDHLPAVVASLNEPVKLRFDADGNLYVAELLNQRVRKIDRMGIITTVAGNGRYEFSGDGGSATEAGLQFPHDVVAGPDGTLYIAESAGSRVRKVDAAGIITTIAGTGTEGFSGDGGPASEASLARPFALVLDPTGNLYIADTFNRRVRRVDREGIITTVAGNGFRGFCCDGGPAVEAQLNTPARLAEHAGDLYVADMDNHRVRKIDVDGTISTVAGDGTRGFGGDGGAATEAKLSFPSGVATDSQGNLYVADHLNDRIRKVDPDGIISTVAGNGIRGFGGDGSPATEASLALPVDIAVDAVGNIYISDHGNRRIRKVDREGIITTVAGGCTSPGCPLGDGGPATEAFIDPDGIDSHADGALYIADGSNYRVRKVDTAGIISTVAGNGVSGFSGDGGPATEASIGFPYDVLVSASGYLYISDSGNRRIRMVNPGDVIDTVAGNGSAEFSGDGGEAMEAGISAGGTALNPHGDLFIAGRGHNRVRVITKLTD